MSQTDNSHPDPAPQLPITQEGITPDASDRVVVIRGINSSRGSFHALCETDDGIEPACGVERRAGTYDDWDIAQAIAWRDPCQNCFDTDAMETTNEQ